MEEEAVVISSSRNKAKVRLIKQSACQHCDHECGLAGDSHEIKEIEVEVENPVGADEGERVALEMGNKEVYFASFLVYLLPLVFMFLGYFLFTGPLGYFLPLSGEPAGMLGALTFLIASFFSLKRIDNYLNTKSSFHPKITKIIK
ncbi:MAG: SoxR reducing system RseC family protein [Bacillota bacterium]